MRRAATPAIGIPLHSSAFESLSMLRPATTIVVCTLSILLAACPGPRKGPPLAEVANQFIPIDAEQKTTATGIPWLQISFNVQREPFDFGIDESTLRRAVADGWKLCEPTKAEWTGYMDMSTQPAQYTQTRTYVLYRDGVLVTLIGMYNSPNEAASVRKHEGVGDRPLQQDFVIVSHASEHESLETAAKHNLRCGKAVG
jgi:hypothetical protein